MRIYRGTGFVNKLLDSLPLEIHIPGYQYCGPGTRLHRRLLRGDPGINPLDRACKEHDIAYDSSTNLKSRHIADNVLAQEAFKRFRSSDASFGERLAALAVASTMKAKVKLGMGRRSGSRKRKVKRIVKKRGGLLSFRSLIRKAWNFLKNKRPADIAQATKLAMEQFKNVNGQVASPRVIPIPKSGGFLPLIPIFAGLSALGALSGGAAGIAKAVNEAKRGQEELKESQRHNRTMEAIALGKGLYLKPYKKGFGLYVAPYKKKKTCC